MYIFQFMDLYFFRSERERWPCFDFWGLFPPQLGVILDLYQFGFYNFFFFLQRFSILWVCNLISDA